MLAQNQLETLQRKLYTMYPERSSNAPLGPRSLASIATDRVFEDVSQCLRGWRPKAALACSGYLKIDTDSSGIGAAQDGKVNPITIRWDVDGDNTVRKLKLPLTSGDQVYSINELITSCKPNPGAPDEPTSHKEAQVQHTAQLGASAFTTDFCPYKCGIIDSVAHSLLSEYGGQTKDPLFPYTYAELVELNVCGIHLILVKLTKVIQVFSGSSAKIPMTLKRYDASNSKPVARMVVYLPLAHAGEDCIIMSCVWFWLKQFLAGGELELIYRDQVVRIDPDANSLLGPNSIQWVAFYSGCKPQMTPIQSGHRLSLKYDLFVDVNGPLTMRSLRYSHSQDANNPMKMQSLRYSPLYDAFGFLIAQPGFMKRGELIILQ